MLRSAVLILSGNAAAALLLLARNLIIARLIPVADYGIAATFAIAMAVVEMMSALGLQQQIVQAKDGDDPRFQAALQGFQVLRGVIAGAVLYALATPIADFLQVPQAAWAYRLMALVPVLNALVHFDIYRMNRQMQFGPLLLTGAVPALASVLAVWPLSVWYGDYKVMLYAVILQAVLTAVTSHLVATRPYRLLLDRAVMGQSLRFGWPLLVNGILLFAVFQGDKLIVGRELGMEALAIFAMGFTLTLTPTLVMAKSVQNLFLPQLSAALGDAPRFAHLSAVTLQAVLLLGLSLVMITVLIGAPVVYLLLGDKYLDLLPYLPWLAVMQAVRVFKAGPAIVALALGHTSNAMLSNLGRVLSLPVCWAVAVTSGDLLVIIWVAIAGEVLGQITAILLLRYKSAGGLQGLIWPHAGAAALLVTAGAAVLSDQTPGAPDFAAPWIGLVFALIAGQIIWASGDLRRYIRLRGMGGNNDVAP